MICAAALPAPLKNEPLDRWRTEKASEGVKRGRHGGYSGNSSNADRAGSNRL